MSENHGLFDDLTESSEKVSFYSDGILLRGDLYLPPDLQPGERRAGIVLCQGFATATGGKTFSALPEFARCFADQGYVCLKFDYRGFGDSEGERWHLLPLEQVSDIRNALSFMQTRDEVDPDHLALFGTSFGGSNVVYAAALDDRVSCVVSNVPVGSGRNWLRGERETWQWIKFLEEIEEDKRQRVLTGKSRPVARTDVQWSSDPAVVALAKDIEDNDGFCNRLSMWTAQAVVEYDPERVVHRISPRPILFIGAEGDPTTPLELAEELYENAREPKALVVLKGDADHTQVYEPPTVDIIKEESVAWFTEHIPARPEKTDRKIIRASTSS